MGSPFKVITAGEPDRSLAGDGRPWAAALGRRGTPRRLWAEGQDTRTQEREKGGKLTEGSVGPERWWFGGSTASTKEDSAEGSNPARKSVDLPCESSVKLHPSL